MKKVCILTSKAMDDVRLYSKESKTLLNAGYELQDVRIELSKNGVERAIQPFTNLRKSFGGFSSEGGALTASRYLTLVEICKLIKKAPQEMLHNFFDMIVEGRRDYENMSQELLCVK